MLVSVTLFATVSPDPRVDSKPTPSSPIMTSIRLDGQLAAVAHGVACVDSQVYERLLHLSWVHFDRTRVGGSLQNQVHMLSTSGAMD